MNETTFTSDQNKLTVKRIFNASVDLVWRAWTEPVLLDQWWAPKPWKSKTKDMDFREGGYRLYAMVGPEGEKHWGRTGYKSIVELTSFSGDDAFCDEDGNVNPSLPVSHFTNHFSEQSGDQTEVTILTKYASKADLEKVLEMGMKEGLSMAFEGLDEVLEKSKMTKQ